MIRWYSATARDRASASAGYGVTSDVAYWSFAQSPWLLTLFIALAKKSTAEANCFTSNLRRPTSIASVYPWNESTGTGIGTTSASNERSRRRNAVSCTGGASDVMSRMPSCTSAFALFGCIRSTRSKIACAFSMSPAAEKSKARFTRFWTSASDVGVVMPPTSALRSRTGTGVVGVVRTASTIAPGASSASRRPPRAELCKDMELSDAISLSKLASTILTAVKSIGHTPTESVACSSS